MADGAGAAEINPYLNELLHLNDGEPIEWGLLLAGINDLDLLAPMDSEDAAALHAHIVRLCDDGGVRRRRGVGEEGWGCHLLSLGLRARATDLPPYAFDLRRPRVQRLDIALSACCGVDGNNIQTVPTEHPCSSTTTTTGSGAAMTMRTKRS